MYTIQDLERRDPGFSSWQDYDHFLIVLQHLMAEGAIREISPSFDMNPVPSERWFVENDSGRVFRLTEPDPPARGWRSEVVFENPVTI